MDFGQGIKGGQSQNGIKHVSILLICYQKVLQLCFHFQKQHHLCTQPGNASLFFILRNGATILHRLCMVLQLQLGFYFRKQHHSFPQDVSGITALLLFQETAPLLSISCVWYHSSASICRTAPLLYIGWYCSSAFIPTKQHYSYLWSVPGIAALLSFPEAAPHMYIAW